MTTLTLTCNPYQLPDIPDFEADFSESTPDEHLEAIRPEHEPFLTRLEALVVCALVLGDWTDVYDFINFHAPETEDA